MVSTVTKVLATQEDLAIGHGPIVQTRQGNTVSVKQIELSFIFRTVAEIRALDVTKYTRVQLHQAGPALEYWYDSTSTAIDDGVLVLLPNSLPVTGRWIAVVEKAISITELGIQLNSATDQATAIETALNSLDDYTTVIFPPATYAISSAVNITTPLRILCHGARFTLAGNNAGFLVEGTIPWFRVEGGIITGDAANRDGDTTTAQVGWMFGNEAAADVADVNIKQVTINSCNIGIKVAYGVSPDNPVERVTIEDCFINDSVGYVGGIGYGIAITQAPGTKVRGGRIKGCQRHGLYFSEGELYQADSVEIRECGKNDGTLRGSLAISRSAIVSINNCNIHSNYDVGINIDVDTQGASPNVLNGCTLTGNTLKDNKYGDMLVGTTAPATDGTPYAVLFEGNTLIPPSTNSAVSIVIQSGVRLSILDNQFDITAITSGTVRAITLNGSDGAIYTDQITIKNNVFHFASSATAYGVQVVGTICTGTVSVTINNNTMYNTDAEFEFLSTVTNNNLKCKESDGRWGRTYTGTGGSTGAGVTVPAGGLDTITLSPASALYVENFSGGTENQVLKVYFTNGNTQINNNSIFTTGALDITGTSYDMLELTYMGGAWRHTSPISAN